MIQDPDPIEPAKCGKLVFSVNGNTVPFPAEMIPKLFVAYVAAIRAEYYAGVDASRCDDEQSARKCFDETFTAELRHAGKHRDEIEDWMSNSMNVATEPCDEIGVRYERHEDKAAGSEEDKRALGDASTDDLIGGNS